MISEKTKEELKKKYEGMEGINNQGCRMKIVKYNGYENIEVIFDDEYQTYVKNKNLGNFKRGSINNPNFPSVFGVGISTTRYPKAGTKEYVTWHGMIERCYSKKSQQNERSKTYIGCSVCKEWLRYEKFYEWIHNQPNYIPWSNGGFSIDKDILIKGNKVYSPDTCCLVPAYINNIFTKHQGNRGSYPIGVSINIYGTFTVTLRDYKTNKYKHYGNFQTTEEAFDFYKQKKEKYIKQVAEEEFNKGNITFECYNAMLNYEVEITD